tara:strand:- start:243 stop:407 length:165 start_codon:yes stop_codon:yes gene_type:complete
MHSSVTRSGKSMTLPLAKLIAHNTSENPSRCLIRAVEENLRLISNTLGPFLKWR